MIKSEGWTDKKGRRRKCKNEGLPGSFTVEASWIMAFILIVMVTIFQNAARIHDETAQAMKLHQAVEKGRHGTLENLAASTDSVMDQKEILMAFSDWDMNVAKAGKRVTGVGTGDAWSKSIEAEAFRPELFLRKVTLIKKLVVQHED